MRIGTVEEAAELCRRSKAWIYARVSRNEIPIDCIVMKGLFDLDRLEKYLADGYFRKKVLEVKNEPV